MKTLSLEYLLIIICSIINFPVIITKQLPFNLLYQLSLQSQSRFSIQIQKLFSSTSDVTVVMASCNRSLQLGVAINSFFHYNTYPIRQFIIAEDCDPMLVPKIWQTLPKNAQKYPQYFKVLWNQVRLGQMGTLDLLYKQVKTKYIYHLEDDWVQKGSYGLIERAKDALQDAKNKGYKISQVVTTFPNWKWTHMPGPLQRTSHGTRYYQLKSYGEDYLYHFSFNPHLINREKIYQKILNKSLINTIARRYHCINSDSEVFLEDGGCVQQYLGKHLIQLGYHQIFLQTTTQSVYEHIGFEHYLAYPKNLDQIYSFSFTPSAPHSVVNPITRKKQIIQQNNTIEAKKAYQSYNTIANKFLLILIILIIALITFICKCANFFIGIHERSQKDKSQLKHQQYEGSTLVQANDNTQ